MAISVSVPKDMNKIKTKVALNLTKRQIICFGAGAVVALPLFFLIKKYVGMETGLIICMISAAPFFVFGIYEKNGMPAETLLYYSIRHNYLRPQIRPRSTDTVFSVEEKNEAVRKEIEALERKAKECGKRKRGTRDNKNKSKNM